MNNLRWFVSNLNRPGIEVSNRKTLKWIFIPLGSSRRVLINERVGNSPESNRPKVVQAEYQKRYNGAQVVKLIGVSPGRAIIKVGSAHLLVYVGRPLPLRLVFRAVWDDKKAPEVAAKLINEKKMRVLVSRLEDIYRYQGNISVSAKYDPQPAAAEFVSGLVDKNADRDWLLREHHRRSPGADCTVYFAIDVYKFVGKEIKQLKGFRYQDVIAMDYQIKEKNSDSGIYHLDGKILAHEVGHYFGLKHTEHLVPGNLMNSGKNSKPWYENLSRDQIMDHIVGGFGWGWGDIDVCP